MGWELAGTMTAGAICAACLRPGECATCRTRIVSTPIKVAFPLPLPLLACLPRLPVYLNRQATIDGREGAGGGRWGGGEGTVTLLEHSFVHKLCEFFKLRISIILIN